MADNTIHGEILPGGIIRLTTDNISDPALHLEMEAFVAGVEKDSGNKYTIEAHKSGKVHTHTDAHGHSHAHQH